MKTIGVLGGLTWQSTQMYYRIINQLVYERLKGENSAEILLRSINFAHLDEAQKKRDERKQKEILYTGASSLLKGGSDFWLMACNTTHLWADYLTSVIDLPFLHIAICVAEELRLFGVGKVALTGTPYTLASSFYPLILKGYGIEVIIPKEEEIGKLEYLIDQELTQGLFKENSLKDFWLMAENWHDRGAEAIVLACTELGLLIKDENPEMKVFDSALIHCQKAVELALGPDENLIVADYRRK